MSEAAGEGIPDAATLIAEVAELSNRILCAPSQRGVIQAAWYAEMAGKYGTQGAHAAMVMRTLTMSNGPTVNITATNSQIGSINAGTHVGDVNAAIQSLSLSADESARQTAEALTVLKDAIVASTDLEDQSKAEALGLMATVAEEANKPPGERRIGTLKAVLGLIPTVISGAKALGSVWDRVGPVLERLLG